MSDEKRSATAEPAPVEHEAPSDACASHDAVAVAVPDAHGGATDAGEASDAVPSPNTQPPHSTHEAAGETHERVPASDASPRLAHAHPKKFSSLNINQRFFQSASATLQAAPKPAAPAPAPAPTSRLSTVPPAAVRPMARTESLGTWGRSSSTEGHESGNAWSSPRLSTAGTAPPSDVRAKETKPSTSRAPWAKGAAGPPPATTTVSTQDFPTAAEAMEADRRAEERAAAQAAEGAARQQAAMKDLERFRGTDLPVASHWDEMEEESEASLDDVVEFGDGTQYKISHEAPKPSPPKAPEPQRAPNAWAAPPRYEPPRTAPMPRADPPRVEAPRPTWGPLAQRHSTLTGQPLPKPTQPAQATPHPPAAPAAPPPSGAAIAAEQHDEMLTAAERARKRREEDERAREAERARARQRAQQIETELREAERQKQAALEAERQAVKARREAERAAREQEARERLAREEAAKQRAQRALEERREAEAQRARAKEMERAKQRAARHEAARAKQRAEADAAAAAAAAAAASPPPPGVVSRACAPAVPQLVAPEPSCTRAELAAEHAPVWRQFRVQLPCTPRVRRAPSEAARDERAPRDTAVHAQSCDPPLGYGTLRRAHTAAELLFPRAPPHVRLPRTRLGVAAAVRAPPRATALNTEALTHALVGGADASADAALFADDAPAALPARLRKPTPRVKLPRAAPWRRAELLLPPYRGGLFDRPTRPANAGPTDTPLVALPDRVLPEAPPTWGGGALSLPLLAPQHDINAGHLREVWSSSQNATHSKNSLEGLVDDVLPAPLGMHELHEPPSDAPHKLDAFALPFQPTVAREPPKPWPYLGAERPDAFRARAPYAPSAAPDTHTAPFMLPADYSDFVLSDTW